MSRFKVKARCLGASISKISTLRHLLLLWSRAKRLDGLELVYNHFMRRRVGILIGMMMPGNSWARRVKVTKTKRTRRTFRYVA
jgi:hypothetical protein